MMRKYRRDRAENAQCREPKGSTPCDHVVPPAVILDEKQSETLVLKVVSARAAHTYRSSVAQRQSIRLLTGGLLVRIQPEEPISLESSAFLTAEFEPAAPCASPCG